MMLATTFTTLASTWGIPALVSAAIAGAFMVWTKRTENKRPDLVSGSYSTLVADLQTQIDSMERRNRALLRPLQDEVESLRNETALLRREVIALRTALTEHNIPHPLGGPLHFAGPNPSALDVDGD